MAIAGKIYKEYNTPSKLGVLSDVKLKAAGIDDKDDRSLVMKALRKAGYAYKGDKKQKESTFGQEASESASFGNAPSTSTLSSPSAVEILSTPSPKRKRKRTHDDTNEFLPDGPLDEAANIGNLDFNEILDEEILKTKFIVVNRAPVMTAWATIVAERMHFSREEALSIASVYTEMNAKSKGVSLGIYKREEERGIEAAKNGTQPYVELMGRRPLYRTQTGQWRALSNGTPVPPGTAFSYISRSFRQTTSHCIGALRLLAESYTPQDLNDKAWSLYAQFRPEVNEWGKRSEFHCKTILGLRKESPEFQQEVDPAKSQTPKVNNDGAGASAACLDSGPQRKKIRGLTLEDYEAALDRDTTFDNVNLDFRDEGTVNVSGPV
ncbi:hypothetical protein B0H34DRAFT_793681 [Crassisporium funariophilum]|nr:hypothetical protein B0H34DRAFT_793681 [Crassisporium funariophilum]